MLCLFFCESFTHAHIIKESLVFILILCLGIIGLLSCALPKMSIRKLFLVTQQRTHLRDTYSIKEEQGISRIFINLCLIVLCLTNYHRRSSIDLWSPCSRSISSHHLLFPWGLFQRFFAVSRCFSKIKTLRSTVEMWKSIAHVRDDAWRWKIPSWYNLEKIAS